MTDTRLGSTEALDRSAFTLLLKTMMSIRAFESRVEELFLAGHVAGSVHLYIGEEATATGVCSALRPGDYITSTHRGHGHAIAKGARLDRMMAALPRSSARSWAPSCSRRPRTGPESSGSSAATASPAA